MLTNELRKKFLEYFKKKGHTIVPSSPVIPHDDPTLLFINAGMNQFKDVFLGKAKRDYTKAASSQKCIRVGGKHNDLENVGHTTRHLTFFEMLGNFSFGDYFKDEAIAFAWEMITEILQLDDSKIYASVFKDDDEAFSLWEKYLPTDRIVRLGEKDNFWQMGDTGPCGPCSELLFDRGEAFSKARTPLEDVEGERFFEFWNLVFMQDNRGEDGILSPLPNKNIDTGMGLERLVALKMGVVNLFQTDVLQTIIKKISDLSSKQYDSTDKLAPSFHVIADHIRCLGFAIADGVMPSNTDRGYVLRKILRRAVRYGKALGFEKPFLANLVPTLANVMETYPELKKSTNRIQEILTLEEEAFFKTLKRGGNLLSKVISSAREEKRPILGSEAFKLKDTYGLPIDEILLLAKDQHLTVDLEEYAVLEEEAKEKSKKAKKSHLQSVSQTLFSGFSQTPFVGYDNTECATKILAIIQDDQFADSLTDEGILLLEKTPFYGEMGGQVGDTGTIETADGLFEVTDCIYPYTGVVAHLGKMIKGSIKKDATATAKIDQVRRQLIQNNHSATHLLHLALEKYVGEHVKQAGSLVDEKKLRFDFSHHKSLTDETIKEIELFINKKVRENICINTFELSFEEASKDESIKQIFGEKYGDVVRVVDMGPSKELCGGTHTSNTGKIGLCKIAKETSIAKGVRRIEMVTGKRAEEFVYHQEELLSSVEKLLGAPSPKLLEKVHDLLEKNKHLTKENKEHKKIGLVSLAESLSKDMQDASLFEIVDLDKDEILSLSEILLKKHKKLFLTLASKNSQMCQVYIFISEEFIEKGLDAKDLIKKISPLIGGGGGGKKNFAQAGGKNPAGLEKAFETLKAQLI
jgi:alanyl-tRNA synthetase